MKILLVHDYGTPTSGAELATAMLRDGLRQRGHDAQLFTSSAPLGPLDSVADHECFGTLSRFRTLLQTANPWALAKLRKVIAKFQPDVVHVGIFLTQLSPLILPPLRKVPCVYQAHWYRCICPVGTKQLPDGSACHVRPGTVCYRHRCLPLRDWLPLTFQMKLWRRWRPNVDVILASSEAVQQRLIADGVEPVEVIYNGVPEQPQRPALTTPPTAAYAGRLIPKKGVDILLKAFARVVEEMPQARLLVAGEGVEQAALEGLIAKLGIDSHVDRLGHLPPAEVERRFAPAWVQVVPSRYEEPFGLVAAEAMMRGTAVVASDAGGLREIVQDGRTGLRVPPCDVTALAQAMLRLLANRSLAEEMGSAGREVALRQFSKAANVEKHIELYERMLSR
jgi:glycosyltransferase involved in cell wall biosynthesis